MKWSFHKQHKSNGIINEFTFVLVNIVVIIEDSNANKYFNEDILSLITIYII